MAIMKNNSNELIAALGLIKEECKFHDGMCSSCPLSVEKTTGKIGPTLCGITGREMHASDWREKPKEWKVAEVRLFKPREEVST